MNKPAFFSMTVIILMMTLLFANHATAQVKNQGIMPLTGKWMGQLQSLRIIFNVITQGDSAVVTLDSPDQGVKGIPVTSYLFKDDTVVFEVASIGGRYAGLYYPDNNTIDGVWYQSGFEFPLVLSRNAEYQGPARPQEPHPPFPYLSEDVTFKNEAVAVTLAGTLTLPEQGAPFTAVILVTGSGPQNRDEEILGHKPFLVIADYLTRQGIAVLRYDDRGVGKSTGDYATATTGDFASDAEAAFEYLKTDKRINPDKIGIIGHSEGAMIAPMVAASHPDVAFIVMLAAAGLSGEETLIVQSEKILKASGASADYIRKAVRFNKKVYAIAMGTQDREQTAAKLKKAYADFTRKMPEQEKNQMGFSDYMVEASIRQLLNPWMRYFLKLNITGYLKKTRCPVLIMNGSKDLQVPPEDNIPPLEAALKEGGNTDYKIVILPGLNHLFQPAKTGSPQEYAGIDETFSPQALQIMVDWIKEKTGMK